MTVAPQLGHAFAVGAVNLRAATALNSGVAEAAQAFQSFAQNPIVTLSLEDLTQTAELGGPLLAGLAPAQAYCNYVTLMFRNVANLQSENVGNGTLAQAAIVLSPNGPGAEGFPSSGPANGPSIEHEEPSRQTRSLIDNNFLHANPYPNVAGPGQPRLCEAGNEKYMVGKMVVGNLPAGGAHDQPRTHLARTEPVRRKISERHAASAWAEQREEGLMSRLRWWRRHDEIPVVELRRSNPVRVGVVFLVILVIAVFFGFTKRIPFKHGFRLQAVFSTAVNIHPKSPVRIAGVTVGVVTSIHREGKAGVVQHGNRTERPADPHRCDAQDPAADLPRRQLVRGHAARQPDARRRSPRATRSR